ncbi:hypothetical protein KGP75_22640 [Burkholderia cenocepacia]|uniref:hypothetical protein n=1 Tax=Burkholderia cepacia complex TaxID=87882 RepID=UPI00209E0BD3|nr:MULTISPECIES: hypothetical protein [Burkholderia cepacia complex]MCO8354314.1 hypothetical protein [Burkholderia multivorans]MCO8386936.1 hypothetical protein [Burkholderia multivorans]MCO8406365.1 hypothetical protein [Burkholderia multivorans]MCO8421441.1 hypothetical protein [Burkholderia cenocepacia]MCO8435661.1 hypothetical protein [Burkholderia multivorans]
MTEQQYEDWEASRPFKDITDDEKVFLLMTREKIDEELKLFRSNHNDINYPTLTIAEIEKRDKQDEKKLRRVLNYMHQLSPTTFGNYEPQTLSNDSIISLTGKTFNTIKEASYAICGILFAVFFCVLITETLMQICVLAKHLF